MKIVHFIYSLGMGGAETLVRDYAVNFNDEHEFEIVAVKRLSEMSANEKILENHNIKVTYLTDAIPKSKYKIFKLFKYLQYNIFMLNYILRNKIDIVHTHLAINRYILMCAYIKTGAKFYHTVHCEPKDCFDKNRIEKIEKICTQKLIKRNDMRLIALHDDMKEEIDEMFSISNTIVFNNGVNLEKFDKEKYDKESIKKSFNFMESDFIVGHIGRFHLQKNHKFLIEVFVELLKKQPKAKLLLVGSGNEKERVVQQLKENKIEAKVTILENRKDIPEIMSIMDVFVFPSFYEGLPVTLVEIQAMSVKCVVSDVVTKATKLTKKYTSVSLNDDITTWCEAILNENLQTDPVGTLDDFDLKKIIKKLEYMYKGGR